MKTKPQGIKFYRKIQKAEKMAKRRRLCNFVGSRPAQEENGRAKRILTCILDCVKVQAKGINFKTILFRISAIYTTLYQSFMKSEYTERW
ncbi:hypothetical protein HMPREF3293_00360 [Christensenella minuta]|uniref:Uncharacterized protein n=1 Tax=Christensenella minuta TaxID=626937 RepID=A0A136Q8B0_9FIRM|nr:hypothetical protein HMPREF3293_00360 [Christensenella minuta]